MRRLVPLLLAAALAACSGTQLAEGESTAASATASESPRASIPSATRSASPRPTPAPQADVTKGEPELIAWNTEFSDYVEYVVAVPLTNSGQGWAEISSFSSDYTLLDAGGGIITTGSFTYALPERIGPGETGYLLEYGIDDSGTAAADFATVEAEARFEQVDEGGPTVEVTDVTWRTDDFSQGLTATGFLTSSVAMDSAAVVVLCLADDGSILGVTSTNLVQNVRAAERKAFETIQSTGPLTADQCATSPGYVMDFGF